ncbi:hypothetical protein BJX70DRAFT_403971 [Aspergillus crustosus]
MDAATFWAESTDGQLSSDSLASHEITKHDVRPSIKQQPINDVDASSPKLGDFSSLWELLGNTGVSPAPKSESFSLGKARPSKKPVAVLKRPTVLGTPIEHPVSVPKSPSKTVPDLSITDTCGSAPKNKQHKSELRGTPNKSNPSTKPVAVLKRPTVPDVPVRTSTSISERRRRNDTTQEAIFSDSNVESDNYPSVFDSPMIPPQVGVSEAKAKLFETPPSSFDEPSGFLTPNVFTPSSDATRLRPLAYKTTSEQRVGLLTKLLKNFPDYAELLIEAGRLKKESKKLDVSSRPVHVFVDMSNIMVGFHDTMKTSRNIPMKARIRRLPLSYQNFSLMLERGRPTAKRVLVGSDRIAATSESEQLGYEANILNRVQKIKTFTPRQLKFRKNLRLTPHDGHSSETNDGLEERWVEQGVDEILHLKILESLLDTDQPATMVLATGDAAEAEYSGGFMKMVERALQRGWKVELVSFSQTTSYAYRKKEFRSRWGDQFRIFALDDYIEELLNL